MYNNPYQGTYPRVLFVCTAGMLRSATAAWLFSGEPYNCNTRCAGIDRKALIRVESPLIWWAHKIYCMERIHADWVEENFSSYDVQPRIVVLDIPDKFEYRSPKLIKLLKEKIPYENSLPVQQLPSSRL